MLLNCGAGVPWAAKRSNQSILKEISPECSLEGLMLKLKLQYLATWFEELTHLKRPWCWERLKVGEEGDDRGWNGWMASPTQWTWVWVNSGSWWWTRRPGVQQSMESQRFGHDWVTELIMTKNSKGQERNFGWHRNVSLMLIQFSMVLRVNLTSMRNWTWRKYFKRSSLK